MKRYILIPTPSKVIVPETRYHIAPAPRAAWETYGIVASITLNVAMVLLFLYWRFR
jgi:hypothetical protein